MVGLMRLAEGMAVMCLGLVAALLVATGLALVHSSDRGDRPWEGVAPVESWDGGRQDVTEPPVEELPPYLVT